MKHKYIQEQKGVDLPYYYHSGNTLQPSEGPRINTLVNLQKQMYRKVHKWREEQRHMKSTCVM
ncbi:hypothetical protein CDL12_19625 [Handroanthus impetiginosus]|uniref:Uncharacterized protein n=1 Tax=Handroanthus impetiginosus TaxID=429701 RepID=A0A2G9GRA3_9LAMI|nr:hypothetical protein CDL12_19625 [Handroanthus impetiginosus]